MKMEKKDAISSKMCSILEKHYRDFVDSSRLFLLSFKIIIDRQGDEDEDKACPGMERFGDQSVEDKKKGDTNKDQGNYRVTERFVGTGQIFSFMPKDKDPHGCQAEKYPIGKEDIGDQIFKSSPKEQENNRPG
jgi:hypothetical protein